MRAAPHLGGVILKAVDHEVMVGFVHLVRQVEKRRLGEKVRQVKGAAGRLQVRAAWPVGLLWRDLADAWPAGRRGDGAGAALGGGRCCGGLVVIVTCKTAILLYGTF